VISILAVSISSVIIPLAAALAGWVIGLAFGMIQDNARRKHERLQSEGKFKTGWAATPGSLRRVAALLAVLALVQFVFPMLFNSGWAAPWCLSAGIVLGYGSTLLRQLRGKLSH
jgi:hypothetical protein